MKLEHAQILNKLKEYLSQPGSEHLRFWQALFNSGVLVFEDKPMPNGNYKLKDDYNIPDNELLKRIKKSI